MYGLILDWIDPSNIKIQGAVVDIKLIIFISIIVLLIGVKLFFMHKKKQSTWNKLKPGTIVYWLYVNPYSGTGSTHKTEVVECIKDKVNLENLGWITKNEFFDGKDSIEFLYL